MSWSHLVELGHRRIAMVTGRADLVSAQLRENGFRAALAEAGVVAAYAPGDYDPDVAEKTVHELPAAQRPPTAVFAVNDATALVTIAVARAGSAGARTSRSSASTTSPRLR